jgi:erythromycin esterase
VLPAFPVSITRFSMVEGDIFYVQTDGEGRYQARLPRAEGYVVQSGSDSAQAETQRVPGDEDSTVDLTLVRQAPASDAVVSSLRENAIPLATVEAGQGIDDLKRVQDLVGSATIVALGEATHGTREFFQLKHRFLEFLVEEMGFRVFAIEANWPECRAINEYVLHGTGDPVKALDGIYFWTWNTQEVAAMIEWMRRHNANRPDDDKVQFLGFDMQTTRVAAADVATYLTAFDDTLAAAFDSTLQAFQAADLSSRTPEQHRTSLDSVASLLTRFDGRRSAHEPRSSKEEWETVRQEIVLLEQATRMYMDNANSSNARDEAMAANVRWLLEQQPPGTRAVLWAHNGHIQRTESAGWTPMGAHLSDAFGSAYVSFGFAFDHGAFQAMNWTQGMGKPGGLTEHVVGPAPDVSVENAFTRVGSPVFVLDLRKLATRARPVHRAN